MPVTSFLFQKHRMKENSSNVLFVTMDRSDKSLCAFITFYCFYFNRIRIWLEIQPSLQYQDQFQHEVYVQVWAEIYWLYNKNRPLLTVLGHTNPVDKCPLLFFNNFGKNFHLIRIRKIESRKTHYMRCVSCQTYQLYVMNKFYIHRSVHR